MKGNIKNIIGITIVLILLHYTKGNASTNDSTLVKTNLNLPAAFFFNNVYKNPGAVFELPSLNQGYVETSFGYDDQQNLHFLHEGTSLSRFNIKAEGANQKDNSVFWGKASYNSSRKQNVSWTNVSDVYRLGPYQVADSIGGNFYGEEYELLGGFSSRFGKLIGGLEAGYRGGSEYRKHDPRPKTIVSDLFAKVGIGYPIMQYQTGISVLAGVYKQNLGITVLQDHTTYRFFLMKGFGQTDLLESDTSGSYSLDYKGKFYGFSAFVFSQAESGFIGNLDFRKEYIDSYIGSNKYPSTFATNEYTVQAGYKLSGDGHKTWFKGEVNHQVGKGTERVYKPGSSTVDVVLIAEHKKYTRNVSSAALSVLQEWYSSSINKWVEAKIGNDIYEERYASPAYKVRYSHFNTNIKGGMEILMKKKSALLAEIGFTYQPLLSQETTVPSDSELFNLSMLPDLKVWETSPYGANIKLLYELPVSKDIMLYAIAEGATLIAGKNMNRQSVLFTVGFRY